MAQEITDSQQVHDGQEYYIRHCRKGSFYGRVVSQDDEWVTVIVTRGVAKAVTEYNVKDVGDELTIRREHCYFSPAI